MSIKLLTAGTALLVAAPAMARPASTLFVDNHWEAPVRVQVDGYDLGTLRPNGEGSFTVQSGFHSIVVKAMNGTPLECSDQWLRPHQVSVIDVHTPMTTLTVTNSGTSALFVSGARGGLWVQPGRSETATVPAGELFLTASVAAHRGELRNVDEQTVWAEPGRQNQAHFAYTPRPTRLLVHNQEPSPVTLYVDGRSYGTLAPGASIALEVRPGPHEVDAYGRHGHVVHDATVRVGRGDDARVALFSARPAPYRPPTYASAGHRDHGHR